MPKSTVLYALAFVACSPLVGCASNAEPAFSARAATAPVRCAAMGTLVVRPASAQTRTIPANSARAAEVDIQAVQPRRSMGMNRAIARQAMGMHRMGLGGMVR